MQKQKYIITIGQKVARCQADTKAGKQCNRPANGGSENCFNHPEYETPAQIMRKNNWAAMLAVTSMRG